MKDLKKKTLRGGLARLCALVASSLLRVLSIMILARLLDPKDFGLVGMVTAFTGVLNLIRDFGLSAATVQRDTVTEQQISTLFWINIGVGVVLGLAVFAMGPLIASFYHEPRLIGVAWILALGFPFNSAGIQHGAMLQREMRFTTMSVINVLGSFLGTVIAIVGALAGYGYWSLVVMTVAIPLITTIGFWLTTLWIPGLPSRDADLHSLVRFGGVLTANSLLIYIATNFEKVLLGKYWGANAIGVYGRAYQLSNIPTDNLNSTAGEVAFAALSRVQNEPARLRSYFLKGYALIVSLTLPITIGSALFAPDIIFTLLGPKWKDAVPVFRLLAPTMLVFAIVNPLAWLLCSTNRVPRLLRMSFVITPIMISGYLIAVPYGPKGVAFIYSLIMVLWICPAILWAIKDTVISFFDMMLSVRYPLLCALVSIVPAFAARRWWGHGLSNWPRLILECGIMFGVYITMLMLDAGQRGFYLDVFRGLRGTSSIEENEERGLISI
jgi:PST family polysaccharide transporter